MESHVIIYNKDNILEEIMFAELLSKDEKKLFAALAEKIITADGIIEEEEKKYLDALEKDIGKIDSNQSFDSVLENVSKLENNKKRAIIVELLIIAKCDNDFAEKEKNVLTEISEGIGIPSEVLNELDEWSSKYINLIVEGNSIVEG